MYKLHYANLAQLETGRDIPLFQFEKMGQMFSFISMYINKNKKAVYLFTKESCEDEEIYITDKIDELWYFIQVYVNDRSVGEYVLQEYPSFESAYNVALLMKEGNPLCYDPTPHINEDGELIDL
jgi:hypothetical protein